jgi:hypothetical protein
VRPFVAFAMLFLPACGWTSQAILVGYSAKQERPIRMSQKVAISTIPDEASIQRVAPPMSLGAGRAEDLVEYTVVETYDVAPNTLPLLAGGFVDAGLLALAIVLQANSSWAAQGKAVGISTTATFGIAIPITEWAFAGIFGLASDKKLSSRTEPAKYTYVAKADGYKDASRIIQVPGDSKIELALHPEKGAFVRTTEVQSMIEAQRATERRQRVVAVMEIEDSNSTDPRLALDLGLKRNMSDQLRIYVAQNGFKTVDRGAQERALKEQIAELKAESYHACYDQACQIELGKALAAQYVVRSQVTRFGASCVLNGELIDLKTEVVVKAASSRGACEPEGFVKMCEDVARNLARSELLKP